MTEGATHPAIEPIAFLLGRWRGEGEGVYPTIEAFRYGEQITFGHIGKPFLAYAQRTWDAQSGAPMHAESGYWRAVGNGRIEMVLAHPTGVAEIEEGSVVGSTIELSSRTIARSSTAKEVTELRRVFTCDGDELRYELFMAAVSRPLQLHLRAVLHRQPA